VSAPRGGGSARATRLSRPSASDRTKSSLPPAPPRPRPRPFCPVAAAASAGAERTNATRVPSGDGVMFDSIAGVVHTGDAALPSIGTRHRSPFFGTISAARSALQNAPFSCEPAAASSRGTARCAASTTYTFETPARSQTKTTRRPSGDHIGFDGWRMSISCSIVSEPAEVAAPRCDVIVVAVATIIDTTTADVSVNVRAVFIPASINPTFRRYGDSPRHPLINQTEIQYNGLIKSADFFSGGSMKRCVRLLLVLFASGVAASASAQVQTGSILVKATDEQGGVVPGVTITISSPVLVSGSMNGVTDAAGTYRFPSLVPGTYEVKLELSGFQTVVRQGIAVLVGQTTPIEQGLKVATLAETVTVAGQSPTVDTTSATVAVNLSEQLLQGTPGGRDIWALVEYKVPSLLIT